MPDQRAEQLPAEVYGAGARCTACERSVEGQPITQRYYGLYLAGSRSGPACTEHANV